MSLNISKKILGVSTVTVEVKISSLPERQRSNLNRFVKTGIIWGDSVPAKLAKNILASRGLSYILRWYTHTSRIYPVNCPPGSKGHEIIKSAYAQSLMEGGDEYAPQEKWEKSNSVQDFLNGTGRDSVKLFSGTVENMHKFYSFDHEVEIEDTIVMTFGAKDSYRSL